MTSCWGYVRTPEGVRWLFSSFVDLRLSGFWPPVLVTWQRSTFHVTCHECDDVSQLNGPVFYPNHSNGEIAAVSLKATCRPKGRRCNPNRPIHAVQPFSLVDMFRVSQQSVVHLHWPRPRCCLCEQVITGCKQSFLSKSWTSSSAMPWLRRLANSPQAPKPHCSTSGGSSSS